MSFLLGLTGSIGMGKSTTADLFECEGCPVWDADAAVHRLYSKDGPAVKPIGARFPEAIVNNAVDRTVLKGIISNDSRALKKIEEIVHPLVSEDRQRFISSVDADILVFDIPLLFETGGYTAMDAVACVSIDPKTQEERVLARGTMTKQQFELIKSKQLPDAEKRSRSDYVIVTDTVEHARAQVQEIVRKIRAELKNA